ncbi:hypothetical protein K9L16_03590 [Candidatus Pacearchaeota archaeon]|nr:hypothetical protein [Candidatus Pacearchaeota archaeon]
MKIKKKLIENLILDLIGFFLFGFGIAAIANSLFQQNPYQIFWGCYLGLIIMGIGIIKRNSFLIMSQVYILAIPLLIWDIDFLYWIIFQQPLWGITDYFFLETTLELSKLISLQHLFSMPLALFAVSKIGLKRKDAWKLSFAQITIIFLLVLFITPPEQNINCVFALCGKYDFISDLAYRTLWFAGFFSMTFLTSILINKFILKK